MKMITEICDEMNVPLSFLVKTQCTMWYTKALPIDDLKGKYPDLHVVIQSILRRLVREHTDLHRIDYRDKQRIASALSISIKSLEIDRRR